MVDDTIMNEYEKALLSWKWDVIAVARPKCPRKNLPNCEKIFKLLPNPNKTFS